MPRLESRIATLELAAAHFDLDAMTDDELRAHAKTCPPGSSGMYAAVITLVSRRPSAFPVVVDDPDYAVTTKGE
jgi:hypothetical protein